MSTLQGKYLRDTYKDLLQISNSNIGVDDTARFIEDGEGTPSILAISTSNVGVGTDTPAYTLDVVGDINLTGSLKVNGADAVFSNWTVNGSDIYRSSGNVVVGNGLGSGITTTNTGIALRSIGYLEAARDGNNPARFNRLNSYGQMVEFAKDGNTAGRIGIGIVDSSEFISLGGGGDNDSLVVKSGGNVGIGTTNPVRKLHLKQGQIMFENTSTGDWAGLDFSMHNGTYVGYMGMLDSDGRFFIDVNSNGDDFVILQNGNVGIGTTNPGSKLTIFNTGAASVDAITLDWEHLTPTTGLEQRIKWRFGDDATSNALSDAGYIAMGKDAWNTGASRSSYISFATANGINQIQYGGTEPDYTPVERMRITKEGNVGIGTTTPHHKLHIWGNNDTTFVNGRSTICLTGNDAYNSAGAGSGISFTGKYLANGEITQFAQIHAEPENPNGSNYDASLVFGTRANGTGSVNDLEKMRITSSGFVGIGKKIPTTRLDAANDFERVRMSITSNSGSGQVAIGPSSGSILVLAHVARAANTNSNKSYLLLVNTRHWGFGGGNNVSVVNSTGSSTGTTGEPTASFGLTGSANSHYLTCSVTAVGGVQEEYYVSLRVISLGPNGL
jgi:hypothetical protein